MSTPIEKQVDEILRSAKGGLVARWALVIELVDAETGDSELERGWSEGMPEWMARAMFWSAAEDWAADDDGLA